MPVHLNPALRGREEALEAEGLITAIDSVEVARRKPLEAGGTLTKLVHLATQSIRGNVYNNH